MDLRQLTRDIRRNFLVAVAVFLICAVVGGAAAFLPAKHYQATTLLLVGVSPKTADAAGATAVIVTIVPQLPVQATDSNVDHAAYASLPRADQGVSVSPTATADPGTNVITITATSTSPRVSAAFANAVAKQVIKSQPNQDEYVITQASPAVPPSAPSNPRAPVILGAAGFGVILGLFAAMWAANFRRRLSRVAEVKQRIGATVLGEIPRVASGGVRPGELFVKHTEPMAMEAFQELRSNLLISLPAGSSATIAVTSCDPAEGKTSVATNIAWALASQDRHVTAIDCDLRKPSLHTAMGVPFGPGVTSRRTEDALAHASRTQNPHLEVIPAGIIDRHPSDIISAHLPLLIDELRARNETVVIDCPPLIAVAETVLIAAMVDLVIVVVDTRRFNPERLQQSLLRLGEANSNVAIVLNRVRFNRRRRGGAYGYGHYHRVETQPSTITQTVVPTPMAPTRVARPNGIQSRPDAGVQPRPKVLRPQSGDPTPTPGGGSERSEQKGRSGYWQR